MTPVPTTVDAPMDLSIKNRRKMRLEEFLRQNLDQAPAGRVIQWVDRKEGIFRILWTHQSSGAFTQQDAALFRYWALARGKWNVATPDRGREYSLFLRLVFRHLLRFPYN